VSTLIWGLLSLVIAGGAEVAARSREYEAWTWPAYAVAVAVFVWSGRRLAPSADGASRDSAGRGRSASVGAGAIASLLLAAGAVYALSQDQRSAIAPPLWLGSMFVLLVAGAAHHHQEGWSPLWGLPIRSSRLVWIAVGTIVGLAVVSRFLWLESVPLGINADEGDRAASAIQIARGTNTGGLFEFGWYHISMVYFRLLWAVFDAFGIGVVQARGLGAFVAVIGVALVTWLGIRHFGVRVGLMSGALVATLGIALQFARQTTEATITATLWVASAFCLLEAVRTGRSIGWIGFGLCGGLGLYFYPSARLWAVLATAVGVYLLIHGLWGRRLAIARGLAISAVAAVVSAAPFLYMSHARNILTLRAEEVSVFTRDNARRLVYYNPEWSAPRLVYEQTLRVLGGFNRFPDGGGFWPTERPLLPAPTAVVFFLGLGWTCAWIRDPRFAILAMWFWVSMIGAIVTIETPNAHRMAGAVLALGLFPAIALDNLARRFELVSAKPLARMAPAVVAPIIAVGLMSYELFNYFVTYAAVEKWVQPNYQGRVVRELGSGTLVLGLGREQHVASSGWIRLLAPHTPAAGVAAPGSDLPLALPPDTDLAFMVFPRLGYYLPYLLDAMPGGEYTSYSHPREGPQFTIYRVPRATWAASQGARLHLAGQPAMRVATIGELPSGATGTTARWTAGLRVPRYWNYTFHFGPGPASLKIDGHRVADLPEGLPGALMTLSLAQGIHFVDFEIRGATAHPPVFEWGEMPGPDSSASTRAAVSEELVSGLGSPRGLLGVVEMPQRPTQRRIDGTIATCCLARQVEGGGRPFAVRWSGMLSVPADDEYEFALAAEGIAELILDGRVVVGTTQPSDRPVIARVTLRAGPTPLELIYRDGGRSGLLEVQWRPPGGPWSIIPPTLLSPPTDGLVGGAVAWEVLGRRELQPGPLPLYTPR
jgi:hypothetical protein